MAAFLEEIRCRKNRAEESHGKARKHHHIM
jgi:hypothetical protein